jgi:hypothetical protein
MLIIISIFLLLKSALKREFTWLDITVASSVRWSMNIDGAAPAWLEMIANLTEPAILPEAWADFLFDWKEDLRGGVQ